MKQNAIIILLTAAVVLLAVNLFEGRYPPRAMGAMEEPTTGWAVGCPQSEDVCFFADSKGDVFRVSRGGVLFVGPARRQISE